jgi:hypothetical protein
MNKTKQNKINKYRGLPFSCFLRLLRKQKENWNKMKINKHQINKINKNNIK